MNVQVLRSPSGVGHVIGNRACLYYPACRATVRDTPTARCVLQSRCTVPVLSLEKHIYNGATRIAPAYHELPQSLKQRGVSSAQAVAPKGTTRCTT
jgi:hypothetical protein